MCRMMIAALVLLLPAVTVAQTTDRPVKDSTCTAAMARSLTIRGIHLGMSTDEVLAMFPGARENEFVKPRLAEAQQPPNFGMTGFQITPIWYTTKDRFEGITSISFSIFDDRVVGYYIQYAGWPTGPLWQGVDDWVAKLSETLHLPGPRDWDRSDQTAKTLACEGIQIRASVINGAGLSVQSNDHVKIHAEREKAYQEKKRREFKP